MTSVRSRERLSSLPFAQIGGRVGNVQIIPLVAAGVLQVDIIRCGNRVDVAAITLTAVPKLIISIAGAPNYKWPNGRTINPQRNSLLSLNLDCGNSRHFKYKEKIPQAQALKVR